MRTLSEKEEEPEATESAEAANAEGPAGEDEENIEELKKKLEKERAKSASQEKKIQYLLADFENLKKRTDMDVQSKVDAITGGMVVKLLSLYDDFARARDALARQKVNAEGLDAILKNMDLLLSEYGVRPIVALGEVFDPKLHEAISIREDPDLDDNTITAELRKGYVLKDRIIRPSLVEISKKQIKEMN